MRFAVPIEQLIVWLLAVPVVVSIVFLSVAQARRRRARAAFAEPLLMERLAPGLKRGETIRLVVPGKVYRYEDANASHDWMFQQMEGLAVGRNVHMGHLLGTIRAFARRIFGPERKVRFRCDYFPYVEPGLDTSVSCLLCNGSGVSEAASCRVCAGTGWLEAIPGGMVHPQVLRNCGIDPGEYTGFAFGAGVDRITALWYRIPDIRWLYDNDASFLKQF